MTKNFGASIPYAGGFRGDQGCADAALVERLSNYKRQVAKRYRVIEPELIERALPDEELAISPKYDGELWFLVKQGTSLGVVAYNGRVLTETAMFADAKALREVADFVIAGELVAKGSAAERPRHSHVPPALGDEALEKTLSFYAFDLVSDDTLIGGAAHVDAQAVPFAERHTRMQALLGGADKPKFKRIALIPSEIGKPNLVKDLYKRWVLSDGLEGLVVRSERGLTYKIKPTYTLDAVVLAYGERIVGSAGGQQVHEVRQLEVGLLREDGNYQLLGSVGGGFSESDRVQWHKRLSTLVVPSSFRLANREGTLCRFVKPEIVVEVQISDLLAQDAWDMPIRRMSLSYVDSKYQPLVETRTAVMIHPVFLRERADKKVDVASVGFSQITAALHDADLSRAQSMLHEHKIASEIVKHAVYTKETKGQNAVRKYVVVQTHKANLGTHAPFVCFFTDFSAGRKEPLTTALRTAASLDAAQRHIDVWIAENIKKGWSLAPSL